MIKINTPLGLLAGTLITAALTVSMDGLFAQDSGLYPPMSVSASDGDYADKVGITWDAVPHATQYRIFRNRTNIFATAEAIGVTPKGIFFDEDPEFQTAATTHYYWVEAENHIGTSAESLADIGYSVVPRFNPDPRIPQLAPPPEPPENPITAAKAFLGKTLFWEEQLSASNTMACGTCHQPSAGGNDQRSLVGLLASTHPGNDGMFNTPDDVIGSPGVPLNHEDGSYELDAFFGLQPQVTSRKAKDMIDAGYGREMAWDGRISGTFIDPISGTTVSEEDASLESQVILPPINTAEMAHLGMSWPQIISKLRDAEPLALSPQLPKSLERWIGDRTYPELFDEVFGDPEISPTRIAFAVATYERTLFGDRTAFDRVNAGILQRHEGIKNLGRNVFQQSRCDLCHTSQDNDNQGLRGLLSDNGFHYIGVRPQGQDRGRFVVTGNNDDRGKVKTPNLRNVGLRKAFMMDGSFASLEEVVDFYDRGGDFNAPNKDRDIRNLNLDNNEKRALVAFLREDLTDPRVRDERPPFDRPILYSESDSRVPVVHIEDVSGKEGLSPVVVAIEPPFSGNTNFTIGISESLAGAKAVLVIDTKDPGAVTAAPDTGSIARQSVRLSGTGNAGWGSLNIKIPSDPALSDQPLYGRWYVEDPAAEDGISRSPVFTFSPFSNKLLASTPTGESRLYNLSVRANLVAGKNLITGFVVTGGEKEILLRTAGPALDKLGLAGFPDPEITLYQNGSPIASNDDWPSTLALRFKKIGAFDFEDGSEDAALIESVSGLRTAIVPAGSETGTVLVETYDAGDGMESKLVNLSARYHVGTGDEVLIAGFTLVGTGTKRVLIRAIGPQLERSFGVEGILEDPILEIFDSNGIRIAGNDNWGSSLSTVFEQVGAFKLDENTKDAALSITLPADATYTAIVRGRHNTTGEALVEVHEIE